MSVSTAEVIEMSTQVHSSIEGQKLEQQLILDPDNHGIANFSAHLIFKDSFGGANTRFSIIGGNVRDIFNRENNKKTINGES